MSFQMLAWQDELDEQGVRDAASAMEILSSNPRKVMFLVLPNAHSYFSAKKRGKSVEKEIHHTFSAAAERIGDQAHNSNIFLLHFLFLVLVLDCFLLTFKWRADSTFEIHFRWWVVWNGFSFPRDFNLFFWIVSNSADLPQPLAWMLHSTQVTRSFAWSWFISQLSVARWIFCLNFEILCLLRASLNKIYCVRVPTSSITVFLRVFLF